MQTHNLKTLNIPNTITPDTDISSLLNDIKYNFEQLKMADLYRGPKGDSLVPLSIDFNEIFVYSGNNNTTHNFKLKDLNTVTNPRPYNKYETLRDLYLKIIQSIKEDPSNIGSDMTNLDGYELFWLEKWIKANDIGNYREAFNLFKKHSDSFLPGSIILMVDSTDPSKIYYTNHYTFVDPRFRAGDIKDFDTKVKVNQKDLSCVVVGNSINKKKNGNDIIELVFSVYNAFPQLTYNKTLKNFTWKMNGQVTSIPASGQKGDKGEHGSIVIVTRIEKNNNQGGNSNVFKVASINGQSLYKDENTGKFEQKVDDYDKIVKLYSGLPCIIRPGSTYKPAYQKGSLVWFGNIQYNETDKLLEVPCDFGNQMNIGADVNNLLATMMDLSVYKNWSDNDGSVPARGLVLPINEVDGSAFYMYTSIDEQPIDQSKKNVLHIDTINDINKIQRADNNKPAIPKNNNSYDPSDNFYELDENGNSDNNIYPIIKIHPELVLNKTHVVGDEIKGFEYEILNLPYLKAGYSNDIIGAKNTVIVNDSIRSKQILGEQFGNVVYNRQNHRYESKGTWKGGILSTDKTYVGTSRAEQGFYYGSELEEVNKGILFGDGKITDSNIPVIYDQGEYYGDSRYIEFKRKLKYREPGNNKWKFVEETERNLIPGNVRPEDIQLVLIGENLNSERKFKKGTKVFRRLANEISGTPTMEDIGHNSGYVDYIVTPEMVILNITFRIDQAFFGSTHNRYTSVYDRKIGFGLRLDQDKAFGSNDGRYHRYWAFYTGIYYWTGLYSKNQSGGRSMYQNYNSLKEDEIWDVFNFNSFCAPKEPPAVTQKYLGMNPFANTPWVDPMNTVNSLGGEFGMRGDNDNSISGFYNTYRSPNGKVNTIGNADGNINATKDGFDLANRLYKHVDLKGVNRILEEEGIPLPQNTEVNFLLSSIEATWSGNLAFCGQPGGTDKNHSGWDGYWDNEVFNNVQGHQMGVNFSLSHYGLRITDYMGTGCITSKPGETRTITFIYPNPQFGNQKDPSKQYFIYKTNYLYNHKSGNPKPGKIEGDSIIENTDYESYESFANYETHDTYGSGDFSFRIQKDGKVVYNGNLNSNNYKYFISKTQLDLTNPNKIIELESSNIKTGDQNIQTDATYKYKYSGILVDTTRYVQLSLLHTYTNTGNQGNIQEDNRFTLSDLTFEGNSTYSMNIKTSSFMMFELDNVTKLPTKWYISGIGDDINYLSKTKEAFIGLFEEIIKRQGENNTPVVKIKFPEGEFFLNAYNDTQKSFSGSFYYEAPLYYLDNSGKGKWGTDYLKLKSTVTFNDTVGMVLTNWSTF